MKNRKGYNFLIDEDFINWRLFRSEEMDEYWGNFLRDNPHLEKEMQQAISQFEAVKINRSLLSEKDKKSIYLAIWRDVSRYKRYKLIRRVSSIVAVFAIATLFVISFTRKEKRESNGFWGREIIIGEALPVEDIYLISGKEKINIAHKSHIALCGDGRALVTDSVESTRELSLLSVELNKLVVPYGKRMTLSLSDGTEVWLNSGTQLDFPSQFMGDKREIYVNGEIFIHVVHNPELPFVVHAQNLDIHVRGTTFNISAYEDDNKKTVVLVEGKVKIEMEDKFGAELLANEKIEVADNDFLKETVNVSKYISWTRGILEFDETPISEIFRKIGRYYNVQFESTPEELYNDKTCSGKLFLSNNLDSVMTSVSVLSSTIYRRENNIIYITKK
ncbi:MAG: DUF4974 domain-containing protein [Bacteroidales bacterium]|nr:DUF4974 domain-containing protein [Bacteroidales bacterium]